MVAGRLTRYILLSLAIVLSLWYWRPSFQLQSPPQAPSVFIPTKLYEPGAACSDNLAEEPSPVSL